MTVSKFGVSLDKKRKLGDSKEVYDSKFFNFRKLLENEVQELQTRLQILHDRVNDFEKFKISVNINKSVEDVLKTDNIQKALRVNLVSNDEFVQEIASRVSTPAEELEYTDQELHNNVHNLAEQIESVDSQISRRVDEIEDRVYKLEKH